MKTAKPKKHAAENIIWTSTPTPLGPLVIVSDGKRLKEAYFSAKSPSARTSEQKKLEKTYGPQVRNGKLPKFVSAVKNYFHGDHGAFRGLLLSPNGSQFQQRVWNELRQIPSGSVRTYGAVAKSIGRPKAARAIGGACNKNPIALFVPCHRVVGKDGSLVGYAAGLSRKAALLRLEAKDR